MVRSMRFIIFYGDGSTHEGETSEDAFRAPVVDVQVIAQGHPEATIGRYLLHSTPYYLWLPEALWIPADQPGYDDYMTRVGFPKYVLRGRTMGNTSDFHKVISRAEKVRF